METFFFWSSPKFEEKIGLKFCEDLFFVFFWSSPDFGEKIGQVHNVWQKSRTNFGVRGDFGARYRPSYPQEKFLSEALTATISSFYLYGVHA